MCIRDSFEVPQEAFETEVDALRASGVTFQTFEMDQITWEGDVAVFEGARSVWFADPDGNILNLQSSR